MKIRRFSQNFPRSRNFVPIKVSEFQPTFTHTRTQTDTPADRASISQSINQWNEHRRLKSRTLHQSLLHTTKRAKKLHAHTKESSKLSLHHYTHKHFSRHI